MITQRKMWFVKCDKCGRMYEDDEQQWYYETKEEAREVIEFDDWWEIKGNKILCLDCQEV